MSGRIRWGDLAVAGDDRRAKVREHHLGGVDGVEVREGGRRLLVFFFARAPHHIRPHNIRIDAPVGARAVRAVDVRRAAEEDPELEDHLVVELDHRGSIGPYRLRLVEIAPDGLPGTRTLRGIDPGYDGAVFEFDVDAPLPPVGGAPPGAPVHDYDVSYLLRDYEGFRQLMLDRLAVTMPGWTERHVPDPWVTLVELLAYVGDDLSYFEDAVATEAYLQTARRRVSVRRHARLVDYRLHEGCGARAWIAVTVTAPVTLAPSRIRFAAVGALLDARPPLLDETVVPATKLAALPQYTPLPARLRSTAREAEIALRPEHNAIELWSWGEPDSRLLAGATSADLVDGAASGARSLRLQVGDVLILEQTGDPHTQGRGPADPTHRQAVRLTEVRRTVDALYGQPLVEARWSSEDALEFELAVRAGGHSVARATGNVVLAGHGVLVQEEVPAVPARLTHPGLTFSTPFPDPRLVARHQARALRGLYDRWHRVLAGWRELAEDGTPLAEHAYELLEQQFSRRLLSEVGLAAPYAGQDARAREEHAEREAIGLHELLVRAPRVLAARRRRLEVLAALAERGGPLDDVLIAELADDWGEELAAPFASGRLGPWGPASAAESQDPHLALPMLELADRDGHRWQPAADLIGAGPDERVAVAEVDDQGIAGLRLGGTAATGALVATYWVGNGALGNTEAEAINAVVLLASPSARTGSSSKPVSASQAVTASKAITAVRNPLPAAGGLDREPVTAAKAAIPGAFLQDQPRALTAEDYAALALRVPGVRRSAAELRFTGSLTIADVAIQSALGEDPPDDLLDAVRDELEPARRINHVLRVRAPQYRPLVLTLTATLAPDAIRADLGGLLARLLGSDWMPDGTPALFNQQRLAFGVTIYASPIIAAVHDTPGVIAVALRGLGFVGETVVPGRAVPTDGLALRPLELPRLDNDPTRRDHGYALVTLEGGR